MQTEEELRMRGFDRPGRVSEVAAVSIKVALAGVLAIGLAGCGSGSSTAGGDVPGGDIPSGFVRPSIPGRGGQAWPSAMPSDIPYFGAELDTFMPQRTQHGDLYGVRMFFVGVTLDQLNDYVETLRRAGWALKPEVYYTPPETEEEADARAAKGDYDAWVATKSPRVLTISVPHSEDGMITFDVDGLTKAESDALPGMDDFIAGLPTPTPAPIRTWPPEWAGKLPEPQGCILGANGNLNVSPDSLWVACGYPDADPDHHQAIIDSYTAELTAAGFTLQPGPPGSEMLVFENGSINVVLMTGDDNWMLISATEH
jgi:hypothetical protein